MPSKKDVAVIRAIGIDTGKNTLHMVGLDEKGAIVLREKVSRNRIAARKRHNAFFKALLSDLLAQDPVMAITSVNRMQATRIWRKVMVTQP